MAQNDLGQSTNAFIGNIANLNGNSGTDWHVQPTLVV